MSQAMLSAQKELLLDGNGSAYSVAETYAELGDTPDALAYLKLSLSRREMETVAMAIEPSFRPINQQAEFRTLAVAAGALPR